MKVTIPQNRPEQRPRPKWPAISLTDEAYDALYALSVQHNVTMRALANSIIIEACSNLEITQGGEQDA